LHQAFKNLLENAVKFVAPGAKPVVRVWTEPRGEWARIWIADNGIGIPESARAKIFGMFERAGGSSYPGTGLGLAIVQRAVVRMNGRIGVESTVGTGSRFWIELPAVRGVSESMKASPAEIARR
jgi:signal transduction histidine kinase